MSGSDPIDVVVWELGEYQTEEQIRTGDVRGTATGQ